MTAHARHDALEPRSARAGRVLLGGALITSTLLLGTAFLLRHLNAYAYDAAVRALAAFQPWLRGLAVGILIWAAVHALRLHRWTPLIVVSVALVLERWFPWGRLDEFSITLRAIGVALALGFLLYPALRRYSSFLRYSGLLVGSVFAAGALGFTAGVNPPLAPPGLEQGALWGIIITGPSGALCGLVACCFWVYFRRKGTGAHSSRDAAA